MRTVGRDREIGFGWRRHGHSRRRGTPGIARRAGAGYRTFPKTTPAFRRASARAGACARSPPDSRRCCGSAGSSHFSSLQTLIAMKPLAVRLQTSAAVSSWRGAAYESRGEGCACGRVVLGCCCLRVPVCRRSRCRALARTRCGRAADRAARRSVLDPRHRPAGRTCAVPRSPPAPHR
jgi:hypothetical protein